METSAILKKVRALEIKTKGLTNQLFAGEYHSTFKGRGMSFSEVRDYQYGDDVRNIDWNVTARYQTPYVKVFEEERELTLMLLVDLSQSAFYGTDGRLRNERMAEICAVLAFSAIKNNDKVGLILFSDEVELFLPPKKGRAHILRIIRELVDFEPKGKKTDISKALRYMNNLVKKRCITFLISDFIDDSLQESVSVVGRRHDLTGIHLYHPWEQDFPKLGWVKMRDAEREGEFWANSSSRTFREEQRSAFEKNRNEKASEFRKNGADFISISLNQSYIIELRKYFKMREKRR